MRIDRVFFAPCALAIGKGFSYLLAFLTALVFIEPTEEAYYFGVIIYCCGCICDYVEVAMESSKKCFVIRLISFVIALGLGLIVVVAFSLLNHFDAIPEYVSLIAKYKFFIGLALSTLWTLPLGSGIILFILQLSQKTKPGPKPPGRYALGYDFCLRDDVREELK